MLCCCGIDSVSCSLGRNFRLQESSGKPQVAYQVKEFVPCAFVLKMQVQIVQVTIFADLQGRHIEQAAQTPDLFRSDRMFDNDYSIVNVASLDKIVVEEVFKFMENTKVRQEPISDAYTTDGFQQACCTPRTFELKSIFMS